MHAPHRAIEPRSTRERFLVDLLDALWERYRGRVEYARRYEELVAGRGAVFLNDHCAFRTIAWQEPPAGIFSISRVFEALGYSAAACYEFPEKHLSAVHYRHHNPGLPKLFVSQLKAWELSPRAREIVARSLMTHRPGLSDAALASLARLAAAGDRARLLKEVLRFFSELPWDLPQRKDVEALNAESQFGAWVLVNGYDVNHFTASVDSHGASSLSDIEKTVDAMRGAGIPMKPEIEGERGSKLRQSSTEAVMTEVAVRDGRKRVKLPWTYAYFEIAERPLVRNPKTRRLERFEGFLGGQAARLFDMTKLRPEAGSRRTG